MTGQKSELKFPSLLALTTRLQVMIDYFKILLLEILKTNVVSWHFLWPSVSVSVSPGDDNTRKKLSKGDTTDTPAETKLL